MDFDLEQILIDAAYKGNEKLVIKLLDQGINPNCHTPYFNDGFEGGVTPLQEASGAGHLNIVQLLLDAGADINKQDILGNSALHRAVRSCKIEVVNELINNRNININIANNMKRTPLMEICQFKYDPEVITIENMLRTHPNTNIKLKDINDKDAEYFAILSRHNFG